MKNKIILLLLLLLCYINKYGKKKKKKTFKPKIYLIGCIIFPVLRVNKFLEDTGSLVFLF